MYLDAGTRGERRGGGSSASAQARDGAERGGAIFVIFGERGRRESARGVVRYAPLHASDLEHVASKLALGDLREVLDLPRELAVQVYRLRACGGGRMGEARQPASGGSSNLSASARETAFGLGAHRGESASQDSRNAKKPAKSESRHGFTPTVAPASRAAPRAARPSPVASRGTNR